MGIRVVMSAALALKASAFEHFRRRDSSLNNSLRNNLDMSWRNQGITGSNNIPLGTRRRFGGDDGGPRSEDNGYGAPEPAPESQKRGRSPVRGMGTPPLKQQSSSHLPELNPDGTKKRKKRNRWGDASENKAAGLMGLTTAITANMTTEQLDAYTLHLRIEEISQKLRINDVVPADGDRSPSPPPQYDNQGRRVNTREYRYRKRLEDERHKLIEKAMKAIPNYHPPSDYRRPTKTQEKVYVPVNDYPEINFSTIANPSPLTFPLHLFPPYRCYGASVMSASRTASVLTPRAICAS